MQGAVPSLGFGGSVTSGMGRHRGIEGLREFGTAHGVVVRGSEDKIASSSCPLRTRRAR